jgi:hypothetical protein
LRGAGFSSNTSKENTFWIQKVAQEQMRVLPRAERPQSQVIKVAVPDQPKANAHLFWAGLKGLKQ